MFDVVTFAEAMIRLSPLHFQRLEQTCSLDVVSVSRLGLKSSWVSGVPKSA
jgi:hypothetical protein